MISSITAYLEELKEAFVPTVAKAEDDVEEDEEDEEDDEDEDDEDEEEEQGDQLDALREECKSTEEGKHLVHHYLECVERVQKAQEEPGYEDLAYKEDCVEEFFHLAHFVDECAAPKLFDYLK
ncbi:Qcr6 [Kluyveromyces lactis]|nr:Qcr6 [Kluyveromyces lactis]